MENLQQIGSKFLFGTVRSLVENHDFSTVLLDKISNDFAAEAGESIPMGDHNAALITAQDSVQYPLESFSLEVDATAEVFNDFRIWELFLHVGDLRGEGVRLRFSADTETEANGRNVWLTLSINKLLDIVTPMTASSAHAVDFAACFHPAKVLDGNIQHLRSVLW